MFRPRYFLTLVILLIGIQVNYAQSFTYSGPTSATIPYGNNSVGVVYYFSYSGLNLTFYPSLSIVVDDNTILAPHYCTSETYLPTSYTITFSGPGSHTVHFLLTQLVDAGNTCGERHIVQDYSAFTVNVSFQISVENIFGGGNISVDGSTRTSPFIRTAASGNSVPVGAIEQDYGNYHWIWNSSGTDDSEWRRQQSSGGSVGFSESQSTSYSVQSNDMNTSLVAGLRKECNISFENNFPSVGNGGTINVNYSSYDSPTANFTVVEQNTIRATAINQTINGIDYTFTSWDNNSPYATTTFTAAEHHTFVANFQGKPNNNNRSLYFNTTVGDPVTLYWTDNPNTNVTQYQIWRIVKDANGTGSPQLIATVSRGIQTYVDRTYSISSSYTQYLLQYDARPYYSTEGTYADPAYESVYGEDPVWKTASDNSDTQQSLNEIKDYSLSSYPNPFNPTSTISYQLPKDGFVTIKVYDATGNEVKTLINEYKNRGAYNVTFNGSGLSSGIYFCQIKVNDFMVTKKLILMK